MPAGGTEMNPIGVNTWVWVSPLTDAGLEALVPQISEWGFDGVELPVENPGDWDPGRTRELLDRYELTALSTCAAMAPGRDLVAADRETVAATQDYVRAAVDMAVGVGAPVLVGPIYASVGRTWRIEDRAALVKELAMNLKPLAEYAGERGIKLGLEALNRFETSVLNTVQQVLEVVDAVNSKACGVLLDTFHMNIEEKDPIGAIGTVGDYTVHIQISGSDRGAAGRDHIDWESTAAAIRGIGYEGGLTIESFTVENESIARAASIWRRLEPSQDDIATVGLATLRRVFQGNS
jgi:D-psicose/D-tagatose/L-ribulose 3-epimerase